MSDNVSVPWAGLFCGRKRELEALEAAWARVSAPEGGPELVVLLGESGLGKTRLVQEFFARLSTSLDGAGEGGYWPDRLTRAANNLKINPDPAECNPSGSARLPYLWWGMRMLDQGGRNSGMAGLHEAIGFLRPHLEPFARARLLSGRLKGAAKAAAIDAAVEIGNVFTFGLLGFGKLGVDHLSEWKEIGEEQAALKKFEIGAANEQQRQSLVDIALGDLAALFDGKAEKGAKLPAVFLLDDAQWLADDETTRKFVGELFDRAKAQGWPLLVIATHWEREWHEDFAAAGESFATLASRFGGEGWEPVALRKEPDLGAMAAAAFPGLDPAQNALLLEKADGNPRLLDEILRYLQRKKGHFEGRDLGGRLSERGEADIREHQFALHELVADRLAEAPENVRAAVGLAGLQGIRFLARLTELAAEAIGESDVSGGLAVAERPHALIARLEDGISEFAQRVYREVALEQLPDLVDEEEAAAALRAALLELSGPEAAFADFSPSERQAAWLVAIELFDPDKMVLDEAAQELVGHSYGSLIVDAVERGDFPVALAMTQRFYRADKGGGRLVGRLVGRLGWDAIQRVIHVGISVWDFKVLQWAWPRFASFSQKTKPDESDYETYLRIARGAEAFRLHGRILLQQGKIEKAGEKLSDAVELDRIALQTMDHPATRYQLGMSLIELGKHRWYTKDPEGALKVFEEVVELIENRDDQASIASRFYVASVTEKMRGPAAALPLFEVLAAEVREASVRPGSGVSASQANTMAMTAAELAGKLHGAERGLELLVPLVGFQRDDFIAQPHPTSLENLVSGLRMLAKLHEELGDFHAAIAAQEEIVRLFRENRAMLGYEVGVEAMLEIARFVRDGLGDDPERVIATFEQALDLALANEGVHTMQFNKNLPLLCYVNLTAACCTADPIERGTKHTRAALDYLERRYPEERDAVREYSKFELHVLVALLGNCAEHYIFRADAASAAPLVARAKRLLADLEAADPERAALVGPGIADLEKSLAEATGQ